MVKINLDDISMMAKRGDNYREYERNIQKLVDDAERFFKRSTEICKVEFYSTEKNEYGNNTRKELNMSLRPEPKEIYQFVLNKMNSKVEELLKKKKALEDYGIIVKDANFKFTYKKDYVTLFEKVDELNSFVKKELEEKEGEK